MSAISLVLSDFQSSVTMDVSGQLYSEVENLPAYDATANFYCTVSNMSNVFQYQTESESFATTADLSMVFFVNLFTQSGVKFSDASGVYWPKDPSGNPLLGNPGNAVVEVATAVGSGDANGAYLNSNMNITSDYIRYLALKLFNTQYGTDLFVNVDDMTQNLKTKMKFVQPYVGWTPVTTVGNTIMTALSKASTYAPQPYSNMVNYTWTDSDSVSHTIKGLPSSDNTDANLTRSLMAQIETMQPARFANIQSTIAPQGLPFVAGDTISYTMTMNAADGQEELTGVSPIPPRTYRIVLNILADETAVNTIDSNGTGTYNVLSNNCR